MDCLDLGLVVLSVDFRKNSSSVVGFRARSTRATFVLSVLVPLFPVESKDFLLGMLISAVVEAFPSTLFAQENSSGNAAESFASVGGRLGEAVRWRGSLPRSTQS